MDADKLIEQLETYGADTAGALERFLDDTELYYSCLLLFIDDREFSSLKEALSGRDISAAFGAAHTLKGVAGNLGLTPLYNELCTLVEALRANRQEELDDLHDSVSDGREQLRKLLEETEK